MAMEERRQAQRLRTYLAGQINFHARCSRLECLVRNMSLNGARLIFPRPAAIPDTFNVAIPQRNEIRRARIIWRNEKEAGIEFVDAETATVISLEATRRIQSLEAQHDALAKRVARLDPPT